MTDQSLGYAAVAPRRLRLRAALRLPPAGSGLGRRGVALATLALASPMAIYFWRNEGSFANIVFTVGVTIALVAAMATATRRLLASSVAVAALVSIIVIAASVKRATMNMVVHAYDLIFYFSSWSTLNFLWHDQRGYMVALLAALAAAAAAIALAWRVDHAPVRRRHALLVFAAGVALAGLGAATKGERRHMQFNFANLYVSSFYASWAETLETLWRGQLLEAMEQGRAPLAAFGLPTDCKTDAKPPHIILIHQESLVQPSLFPALDYDHGVDPMFRSQDGQVRKLRVETYGGASWLTEFSILAGVSTHSFGGMRQFVQTFMQGRLKDTLPQALERCGYRNVVFYPMLKNFVSNDKFYTSVGLREIFDLKAQGAKTVNERDRFYFANALAEMERHFKASPKPLFTFIQTMSAHWPYDVKYMPEENVAGGGPGTHPEMHEYLRRVSMAKLDYDWLLAELHRRFPGERFLLAHYGDHQPMSTRMLLGYKDETEAEDVTLSPDSPGFITYYALDGVNFTVRANPSFDALDVPYLGTAILDAAGLPLSDSHAERRRLMALCKGRYYGCARRNEILAFHRRLIDSGIMQAR